MRKVWREDPAFYAIVFKSARPAVSYDGRIVLELFIWSAGVDTNAKKEQ